MPKTGSMTFFASRVTGSRATGSPLRAASAAISGRSARRYQPPAEDHAELVRASRAHRLIARLDHVAPPDLAQDVFGGKPVQIAQHAVVIENRHLLLRQQHGQEIAVRPAARLRDAQSRSRAVMAIGDIERGQGVDRGGERRDGRLVVDHPELVANAVIGGDVDRRVYPRRRARAGRRSRAPPDRPA